MRPEHRASLLLGVLALAVALLGLGALALASPDIARGLLLQISGHLAVGKETGIPIGLAAGVPPRLTWAYAVTQDAVVMLLGVPLAFALRGRLERTRRGAQLFHAVESRARSTTPRGEVGLTLGLALTTWIPMLPTGALFAALVGAFLGVRARVLLPILVAASAIACAFYTVAYGRLLEGAARLDPRLPAAIVIGLGVAFALGGWLVTRRRRTG